MNFQHQELENHWKQLSIFEQMANIGSEVERALNWRAKNNIPYCQKSLERALELTDLSLGNPVRPALFRELTLVREALTDFFSGPNQFMSTDELWRKYFLPFGCAARKNC